MSRAHINVDDPEGTGAEAIFALLQRSIFGRLEMELIYDIFEHLDLIPRIDRPAATRAQPTEETLPLEGHPSPQTPKTACSLTCLPAELRRAIFAYSLVARDVTIPPTCGNENRIVRPLTKDGKPKPPIHNRASTLMCLNKTTLEDIATILYEERYFVLHVHEGLRHGGDELLDSGRQKLQYREEVFEDTRFARFIHGEAFDFCRLKKIKIIIYAPADDEPGRRHMQINSFFMIWALCQLLRDGELAHRLMYISIEFEPRGWVSLDADDYLWDPVLQAPTLTSIQFLPNIELLLRPFAILRSHNVEIRLPDQLRDHEPSKDFVARLKRRMLSTRTNLGDYDDDLMNEDYAHNIRGLSGDFLRYVGDALHGKGHRVDGLGAGELWEHDDEDGPKRCSSPTSEGQRGDFKRPRMGTRRSSVMDKSPITPGDEEEMLQRAIAASLQDSGVRDAGSRSWAPSTHGTACRPARSSPPSSAFSSQGRTLGDTAAHPVTPPPWARWRRDRRDAAPPPSLGQASTAEQDIVSASVADQSPGPVESTLSSVAPPSDFDGRPRPDMSSSPTASGTGVDGAETSTAEVPPAISATAAMSDTSDMSTTAAMSTTASGDSGGSIEPIGDEPEVADGGRDREAAGSSEERAWGGECSNPERHACLVAPRQSHHAFGAGEDAQDRVLSRRG
ncbi:hypothetical protein LTR53_004874 [Teratosphaeriaceae sp. CCFEE 6253]|nr:hypothetical protein LTR53_004874 [Teratosphaeriaceae sp. CCFEE 6253]